MNIYHVFGYGKDGKAWMNEHQAEVVKVTDAGCLLFGNIKDDELAFEHGYGAGVWKEFKRVRKLSDSPAWVVAEQGIESE